MQRERDFAQLGAFKVAAAGADGAAMNQIAAMHVNHRICMLAHLSCGTIRSVYQIFKCAHLRPFHWWMLLNACPAR